MAISRRNFMRATALAAAGSTAMHTSAWSAETGHKTKDRPLFVSTWLHGKRANEAALKVTQEGGSVLDAVETGIGVVEIDCPDRSVGYGGLPNAAGVVQMDACIMGPGHQAGSVAAIEGILHPISAARRVMEKTPHVMLVGAGAREFALAEGLETAPTITPEARAAWERWLAKQEQPSNHDTVSVLGLGADGSMAGGCSTSGWGFKMPGRVGDSPILGSGLYVDDQVGAAGATGLGEIIMRYCGSFLVVEYMRQGMSPTEACSAAVRRIVSGEPAGAKLSVNFVALDKEGRFGASGIDKGFVYSVTTQNNSEVMEDSVITDLDGHEGAHSY
jgi:N4-(beta-N-acetylglucosaminyl)-L-asparaginase